MHRLSSMTVLCAYFLATAPFSSRGGFNNAFGVAGECRECSESKMFRSSAAVSHNGDVAAGEDDSAVAAMHEARRDYYRALILHKLNVSTTWDSSAGDPAATASFTAATSRSPVALSRLPSPPSLRPSLSEVAAKNLLWLPEQMLSSDFLLPQDRPGDIRLTDFYAETKQYLLLAGDASAECRSAYARRRTCLTFDVKTVTAQNAIVSAKLYVWTPEADRLLARGANAAAGVLQVRQLSPQWRTGAIVTESLPQKASVGRRTGDYGDEGAARKSNESKWLQFDIRKEAVRSWLSSGLDFSSDSVVRLELTCKDCGLVSMDVSRHRPFLLIDIEHPDEAERLQQQQQRSRRQATSGGGSSKLYCDQVPAGQQTCCIERLQVLFSEFYPYVVHPKGFYPNYCRGSCSAFGQQTAYTNTNIVRAKLESKKIRYVPCCVPTRMASIDVLYFADDGNTIQMKSLPNMVVEECGCM